MPGTILSGAMPPETILNCLQCRRPGSGDNSFPNPTAGIPGIARKPGNTRIPGNTRKPRRTRIPDIFRISGEQPTSQPGSGISRNIEEHPLHPWARQAIQCNQNPDDLGKIHTEVIGGWVNESFL